MAAWHNHKVKVYDPTGGPDPAHAGHGARVYTIAGTVQGGGIVNNVDTSGDGNLATVAKYNLLPGIVLLPGGDLLTADAGNEVIRRIALSSGTLGTNLVGTQVTTGTISLVAGTRGVVGNGGDDGPAAGCTLNFSRAQNAEPDGRMEMSPDGTKVYVICGNAHCIRVIDLAAAPPTISRFAGTGTAGYAGDGGQAKLAQLNRPSDIAVATDGTVFISDSYNNVIRKVAPDGVISTYAGSASGAAGAAADDIPVAEAVFRHPAGLELDADGNLYVCDRENSVIRVITPPTAPVTPLEVPIAPYEIAPVTKGGPPAKGLPGHIDTYCGSGTLGFNGDGKPALETDMYWPQDLTVDPNLGQVYVLDWNNHRIRRIEDNGTVTTVVGSGLLGDTGGEGPTAKLNHPTDMAFHPTTGDLWIAAWHTDKILRVDSATSKLYYMAGRGRAFTGDGFPASDPVTGFDPAPVNGVTPPTPVGMAQMNIPVSVKFTANGDWYVSDQGNERIRRVIGTTDIINTICGDGNAAFGGDNGPAAAAQINVPVGQAAQPAGRICISPDERWLYLADTGNNRIRRIDLQDALTPLRIDTYVGNGAAGYTGDGGQATAATLNYPTDVDCDADGNLYIADRDNDVIRRVDAVTKVITTIAGDGVSGYVGDGSVATAARLREPSGIFVVRDGPTKGRIYIADTYNGVVRVVWEP
jgi:sugar lactone lactonase YvrE